MTHNSFPCLASDHDIGLTEGTSTNGIADISIPANPSDTFNTVNCPSISFTRSDFVHVTGGGPREQMNDITSFIDASNVYGSDDDRAAALRTFKNGELKTSQKGLNLPYNDGNLHNAGSSGSDFFLAGDIRANEQIGLIAMHTLFVREHNRLAELILDHYPTANDEEVYQLARKIVIAEMQAITYKEFLPALLGSMSPSLNDYNGYNASVDPRIATEFSTAAFRFGHSMLSPQLHMSTDGVNSIASVPLRDAFFNPGLFASNSYTTNTLHPYTTDLVLGGLMIQEAQMVDLNVIDDIRMFLFGEATASHCLDLVSLNIQRGRDHGIRREGRDLRHHRPEPVCPGP